MVRSIKPLVIAAVVIAGVAALYLARGLLIPIALAILLTFMVHPLVGWLTRLGLGRALSVGVVVTMLFATLGAAAWVVTTEVAVLSVHIPAYRDNLIAKIAHVRRMGRGGTIEGAAAASAGRQGAAEGDHPAGRAERPRPAPCGVHARGPASGSSEPDREPGAPRPVIVLVIFMLIEWEDCATA